MSWRPTQRRCRHISPFLAALACLAPCAAPVRATEPLHEMIDRLVDASLLVTPAPAAGDAEFLRRLSLDLCNRIASTDEVRAFLQNPSANKRAELINTLLASPQHARRLANYFDVTLMERRGDKYVPRPDWENWLYQACLDNRPWDQLASEVLGADGVDPTHRPPAKFCLEREADPHLLTRDVGRVFFGRDVQCAQCHDHPNVEDYEQREYYGLYSFFQRTELVKQASGVYVLGEKPDGDVSFKSVFAKGPTFAARPALPGGAIVSDAPVKVHGRRDLLAQTATAGGNRAFNRTIVNRLWAMMMGRGLVHPVDFDHSDNPPTHPELLDRLADEFAAMKYDVRAFLRELALSRTYQRSFDLPTDFNRTAADITDRLPELEAALTAAQKAVETAIADVKTVRPKAQAARQTIDKTVLELRAAEAELAKVRKPWETATAALAETRRKVQAETDANAALVKAIENARQAAAALPADADLKQAVEKLQAKSAQLTAERTALSKTIPTQSDAIAQLNDKVQAAEKPVAAATAKVRQAEQEAQPVIAAWASVRRVQQKAKAALAVCERNLRTAKSLTEFRSKATLLAQAEDRAGPAPREVETVRRTLQAATARSSAKQRDLAAAEHECETLRQTVTAATDALKQRQLSVDTLTTAAEQVEKAAASLKDEDLRRAAAEVRQRTAALAAATAGARKQLAARQADYAAAIAKRYKLRAEKPNLDRGVATATAQVSDLETKYAKQLAELQAARSAYNSARQDLMDRLAECYAVAPLKALTPEQLHWSVLQATGILRSYESNADAELNKKQPLTEAQEGDARIRMERAIAREKDVHAKLAGNLGPFVNLFAGAPGQPQFEFFATADQALFMENSDTIRAWTAPGVSLIQRLTKLSQPVAFAEELYLSVLNRQPTPDEVADVADWLTHHNGPTPTAASDLAWALLASVEFRFNH
jgi:predicted nuclease with TOPRIM domain